MGEEITGHPSPTHAVTTAFSPWGGGAFTSGGRSPPVSSLPRRSLLLKGWQKLLCPFLAPASH